MTDTEKRELIVDTFAEVINQIITDAAAKLKWPLEKHSQFFKFYVPLLVGQYRQDVFNKETRVGQASEHFSDDDFEKFREDLYPACMVQVATAMLLWEEKVFDKPN
jgi:hypothetical protein